MEELKEMTMSYMGQSYYDYPAYMDEHGKIWFDINYGRNEIDLYSASGNDIDGEPDIPIREIYPDTKITFVCKYERNPREYDYMLLSRYKMDCEYYISNGNRCPRYLYSGDPKKHIEEMEKLYDSFEDDEKPEWLTKEDIQDYKKKMCEEAFE